MAAIANAAGATHVALRVGAGLLFMFHGAQKLLGWFGGMDGEGGTAVLVSQMGLAGFLELAGGLMIVIGLFVRPVALVLIVEMIVAYAQAHLPQGPVPIQNGGELAVLYALMFLYFAGNGAGALSLDAVRHRPLEAAAARVEREELRRRVEERRREELRRRRAG